MGSWDETCALTGLPVRPGDKVYFQVIAANWCPSVPPDGADGYYRPVLYPLTGVYDDYGRIREVEKNFAFDWLDRFLTESIGTGAEDFMDDVISHELPYEAANKQFKLQMASCFFLADAYEMAREAMDKRQQQSWEKAVRDLPRWSADEKEIEEVCRKIAEQGEEPEAYSYRVRITGQKAALFFRRRYGEEFLARHFYDHPEDFALIKPFVEFDIAFNRLRRQYMPLTGSQCWAYELHRKVAMWTCRTVNQIEQEFAKEGDRLSDYC